jgi:phosphoribosylamine--glycine ligase
MNILVVGSGGREHALVWKLRQSPGVERVFCAPGNGGIAQLAECVDIGVEDVARLVDFARQKNIALTVVGPEASLACGIADAFIGAGLRIFAPCKAAAKLEASKVFAKELMRKYRVPTAAFKVFDHPVAACAYIDSLQAPCVVKADGLAAGKGVVVASTAEEAKAAVRAMMIERVFADAGARVIVEERLQGEEASILVLTDSRDVIPLASSQDHKRVFDGDKGPNTGGMGAYSPAPVVTEGLMYEIMKEIVSPTVQGLRNEGIDYRGVLYAGVMVTQDGPKALEFNVRFGDPETQAILPRLQSDLAQVMCAVADGTLGNVVRAGGLRWDPRACVCVVCASKGYPGDYEKGKVIRGLESVAQMKDAMVFHAGTSARGADILTSGGRVLGVTGLGAGVKDALLTAYAAVGKISFEGMHFRKDIGYRALARG